MKNFGKLVYENHLIKENDDVETMIEDKCIKIDDISKEIEELLEESLRLKNTKICINCSAKMDKENRFCPVCGKEQPSDKKDEEKVEEQVENEDLNTEIIESEQDNTGEILEAFVVENNDNEEV